MVVFRKAILLANVCKQTDKLNYIYNNIFIMTCQYFLKTFFKFPNIY